MNFNRFKAIIIRQTTSLGALAYYTFCPMVYGLNKEKREIPIVVTMTSFPARFKTIHLAIKSIMAQRVKPDKIILYLDENVEDAQITEKMRKLEKYGLEIKKRPVDMKVHKKYFYAMKEYPDAIIITADDDCMYRKSLIGTLLETYRKYPKSICAKRVHRMIIDEKGELLPYNKWDLESNEISSPSMQLCATGVGGVLYPPNLLKDTLFDLDLLMELSPKADDLWLKYIEVVSNVPVVRAPGRYNLSYMIQSVQELGLRNANVTENQNDIFLERLQEYFKINWKKVFKENQYREDEI